MTVKAEARPSGSAGDSASVITPLFRIQSSSVSWCACRGGAKRRRSRIKTVTHFYGQLIDERTA